MELLMQEFHMYLLHIKSSPKLNGQHGQVEFVDKNHLEDQNPGRDTRIPTVSAGLALPGGVRPLKAGSGRRQPAPAQCAVCSVKCAVCSV